MPTRSGPSWQNFVLAATIPDEISAATGARAAEMTSGVVLEPNGNSGCRMKHELPFRSKTTPEVFTTAPAFADQAEPWAAGQLRPMRYGWARIRAQAERHQVLERF